MRRRTLARVFVLLCLAGLAGFVVFLRADVALRSISDLQGAKTSLPRNRNGFHLLGLRAAGAALQAGNPNSIDDEVLRRANVPLRVSRDNSDAIADFIERLRNTLRAERLLWPRPARPWKVQRRLSFDIESPMRSLCLEVRRLAHRGQHGPAIELLLDGLRLGARVRTGGAGLGTWVQGDRLIALGQRTLRDVILQHEIRRELVLEAKRCVAELATSKQALLDATRLEFALVREWLQLLVAAPEENVWARPTTQLFYLPNQTANVCADYFRELLRATEAGEARASRLKYSELSLSNRFGRQAADLACPSTYVPARFLGSLLADRFTETFLALELYRIDEGHLPQALADLVPEYLSAVPNDPFQPGVPLQYDASTQRLSAGTPTKSESTPDQKQSELEWFLAGVRTIRIKG